MRNFESEWDSTSKFDMKFLDWFEFFCSNVDFIWSYFDLISASECSLHWIYIQILQEIVDSC